MDLNFFLNLYGKFSSCYLQKQILPEHVKTCTLCINIEDVEKVKVTTQKSPVLKSCIILILKRLLHTIN